MINDVIMTIKYKIFLKKIKYKYIILQNLETTIS